MKIRMDKRGRITLSKALREELGLAQGDRVEWVIRGDEVQILPVKDRRSGIGKKVFGE